jgi:WD40 repeat protein
MKRDAAFGRLWLPVLVVVCLVDQHCPGQERKEPRERATLRGHTKPKDVSCAVFSPDGKTLASVGFDGLIIHWDVATGKELSRFKGHVTRIFWVAVTRDGKTLATSALDDGEVKLWDRVTGKELARLLHTKDPEGLRGVVFSPDDKLLASAACDGTIKLWDVAAGKEKATLEGHDGRVMSVAFTPDGKTLISVEQEERGKFWDVATGKEKMTFDGRMTMAITADGKTLASRTHNGMIKLWDVATGKERATRKGRSAHWIALAFSGDGKLLASGTYGSGIVKLWDVATGAERATMKHTSTVWALAFGPDNKTLASCSADGTIKLWDTAATHGDAAKSPD